MFAAAVRVPLRVLPASRRRLKFARKGRIARIFCRDTHDDKPDARKQNNPFLQEQIHLCGSQCVLIILCITPAKPAAFVASVTFC